MGCNKVIDALPFDEYQVTHLPARTITADGLEIGMVKVKRYARIHLQVPKATHETSYSYYVTSADGVPGTLYS
jgi:hypothetical protein